MAKKPAAKDPQAEWEKTRTGPRNGGSWTYDDQGRPVRTDEAVPEKAKPKTEPKEE